MSGEVLHPSFEEGLMLIAWNVFGDVGAPSLSVPHFPKDAAAGAGDAFDGKRALVRVAGFE